MPIPVIAVTQRKGGPGKTTLARTLAEYWALIQKRSILLIDFDTQCNLSDLFLPMERHPGAGTRPPIHPEYDPSSPDDAHWNGRSSSADIFYSGNPVAYPVVRPEGVSNIHILPGDSEKLIHVEEQDKTKLKHAVENRTFEFLDGNAAIEELFDIIIIDTAPSASPLTRSALRAASHMLVPMELEEQCWEGTHEMLSLWRGENSRRPSERRIEILAIQPNKVKMTRMVHQEFLNTLKSSKAVAPYLSPVLIPDRAEFAERDTQTARPRSIYQLPPSNPVRKIAVQFGDYIHGRLFAGREDSTEAHATIEPEGVANA